MKILNSIILSLQLVITGLAVGCNDKTPFVLHSSSGFVTGYSYAFTKSGSLIYNLKAKRSGAYLIQAWEGRNRCGDKLVFQSSFFANEDEKRAVPIDSWNGQPCVGVHRIDVIWSDGYNIETVDMITIEDNQP